MNENQSPARMRFRWLDAVATDARLPPLATRVAVVLGRWLNSEGSAWPSVATVAASLGATDRAVQKVLAALVEAGHLTIERNGGRGRTNVMTIVVAVDADLKKGERADTLSTPKRVNVTAEKGERGDRKGCPHVRPNHYGTNSSPPGSSIEPEERRDARAPDGAALGDLSTLPPDIRADIEDHERRLIDGIRDGRISPSEANEHRRKRARHVARLMETTAHG